MIANRWEIVIHSNPLRNGSQPIGTRFAALKEVVTAALASTPSVGSSGHEVVGIIIKFRSDRLA